MLIVESDGIVARNIDGVGKPLFQLNQTNHAIVHDADVFRINIVGNFCFAIDLNGANALGIDKNLVGDGLWARYSPRRSVVCHLFHKQIAACGNHLIVLAICVAHIEFD